MNDAEPTAAQQTTAYELAPVLRAVRANEVWLEHNGRSVETCRDVLGVSDPIADVTELMHAAEVAGLAVRPTAPDLLWVLTASGRRAVADLDEPNRGPEETP